MASSTFPLAASLLIYLCVGSVVTESVKWSWRGGGNDAEPLSVFDQPLVPSPRNVPGARRDAIGWIDSSTNKLFIFGGRGYDTLAPGALNDIWSYDMGSEMWTWVSGNTTRNQPGIYDKSGISMPGARIGAIGWYDNVAQELWVFGGYGYAISEDDIGFLNDLWVYRMNDSTWTWIAGSNSINEVGVYVQGGTWGKPGGRREGFGWYDSSTREFWLFGGEGLASDSQPGLLNDLWKYSLDNDEWTWKSGFDTIDQTGIYGDKNSPNPSYTPGSRQGSVGWFESSNKKFWLFGGFGFDSNGNYGFLNDLWYYDVENEMWAWIAGSEQYNQKGIYDNKGSPTVSGVPGGRSNAVGWFDELSQEFWLFGGQGFGGTTEEVGTLNDLWRYQVNTDTWTWMAGSDAIYPMGTYGVKGSAGSDNIPSGLWGAVGAYDSSKKQFWLFGGETYTDYINELWTYQVLSNSWTWFFGGNTRNKLGVYGVKQVASNSNVPGIRYSAVGWYDSSAQELWVFGGIGYGKQTGNDKDYLNDLWKYRLNDSTWTWMSGSDVTSQIGLYGIRGTPNPLNVPGAREGAAGWYDSERQEFWLFGGLGYDEYENWGYLNDLWVYRVSSNMWTWVAGENIANRPSVYSGAGSYPGGRKGATVWFDTLSKEFWLFGGYGWDTESVGPLNELWKYQVNDDVWRVLAGAEQNSQPGNYGEKNKPSTLNYPGSRYNAVGWYDGLRKELWLFGGRGFDGYGFDGLLNDLWRFDFNNLTWTWISGSDMKNEQGTFGLKGIPNPANVPAAREGAVGWFDSDARELWLFGGNATITNYGLMNDLWRFSVSDSTWTWMSGDDITNQPGIYGEKGFASSSNTPGSRAFAVGMQEFWLFGGDGYNALLSDVWKLTFDESDLEPEAEPEYEPQQESQDDEPQDEPQQQQQQQPIFEDSCPPLYHRMNETCVPDVHCTPEPRCELQCNEASAQSPTCSLSCETLPTNSPSSCLIEGNVIVNGSITESKTRVIIYGSIQITGTVAVSHSVVKLEPGSELIVGKCLVLEEDSQMIVAVDSGTNDGFVFTSYDESCELVDINNVIVEPVPTYDECRDGRPYVEQAIKGGRAEMSLLFVPAECASQFSMLAIYIAVPIAAFVLVAIIIVLAVPPIRKKTFCSELLSDDDESLRISE